MLSIINRWLGCYLELPVRRLQKLLRLIRRAARGQNKLVDHHLMSQLVHIHRHRRCSLLRDSRERKTPCVFVESERRCQGPSSFTLTPRSPSSNNKYLMSSSPTTNPNALSDWLRSQNNEYTRAFHWSIDIWAIGSSDVI